MKFRVYESSFNVHYKYVVEVSLTGFNYRHDIELLNEIGEWCNEQFNDRARVSGGRYFYGFKYEADRNWFLLRWL